MKPRKLFLNLAIGVVTFFFGLAWFNVFDYFLTRESVRNHESPKIQTTANLQELDQDPADEFEQASEFPFDPAGKYYFIHDEVFDGFEDFFFIVIQNKNLDVDIRKTTFGDPIPRKGFIITHFKSDTLGDPIYDYIDMEKITIGNSKISFETKPRKGVKYEFNGEFLVRKSFSSPEPGADAWKGTLIKKRNGKIIAAMKASFSLVPPNESIL